MEYKHRILEEKIQGLSGKFGAILVTGPRQSGKTWLFSHIASQLFGEDIETVSFDTPAQIDSFRRDPELFFQNHPKKLFLDEVQHVPDIFPYLKKELDKDQRKFRFFLSGSQHFELMKGVSESLAGRAAVLDLWPFGVQELRERTPGAARATLSLIEDPALLNEFQGENRSANDREDVVPLMLAGGYPPVAVWNMGGDWLEAYRRTYIQRDVRQLSQVADLGRFDRFVMLVAGRTGTIINKAELGRIISVDNKTVDHWLSLLETSYQVLSLPAHHSTTTKRLARRRKWVFADIGLCLHLQGIRDEKGLFGAPHFGMLFESFVIMEIRKMYGHLGLPCDLRYWRTQRGLECDLVIAAGGRLIPIEIKHTASPTKRDWRSLNRFLDDNNKTAEYGLFLSMSPKIEKLDHRIFNFPLGLLLNGIKEKDS